jgi:hypothetical protein
MNTNTIETNVLPIDYHANRINDCRNNIKTATFEFMNAIKLAHDELGDNCFQVELSQRIGMSPSTLSRWLQISKSKLIKSNTDSVPPIFSSLYEICLLESKYYEKYGEDEGFDKLQALINRKSISEKSEQNDIKKLLTNIKDLVTLSKKISKQNRVIELSSTDYIDINEPDISINSLIDKKSLFKSFVVFPPSDLLTQWGEDGFFMDNIHKAFPIAKLRTMSSTDSVNCFVCIPSKRLNVGIKILISCGFNYRDIFVSNDDKRSKGYSRTNDDLIIVHGQRGVGSNSLDITTKSTDLDSILQIAETMGSGPSLLLFNKTQRKGWTCLSNPL